MSQHLMKTKSHLMDWRRFLAFGFYAGMLQLFWMWPGQLHAAGSQTTIRMVRMVLTTPSSSSDVPTAFAFPVPFKPSLGHTNITFVNLPSEADIKVFTINGELVKEISHSDANGSPGQEVWDVTNNSGQPLGSDVFFYLITAEGQTTKGKILVVR